MTKPFFVCYLAGRLFFDFAVQTVFGDFGIGVDVVQHAGNSALSHHGFQLRFNFFQRLRLGVSDVFYLDDMVAKLGFDRFLGIFAFFMAKAALPNSGTIIPLVK